MLRLVFASYKLYVQKFLTILKYALPYILLCCIAEYTSVATDTSSFHMPLTYLFLILISLASAATDVTIYRHLLGYKIINPLSSQKAYFGYLFSQILISLIGSTPLFLFMFMLNALGYPYISILTLSIIINVFVGFMLMARFNIILPLIIQNKTPNLKDFLSYTNKPYLYWVGIGLLIYTPYIIIHYATNNLPYINIVICNMLTYLFVCFNITYVSKNKQDKIPVLVEIPIVETQKKVVVKVNKAQAKEKKVSKPTTKKTTKKTTTGKKTTKTAKPKLKPLPA